jgi:hypothetical protein
MTKNFDRFVKLFLEFTSFLDLPETPPYGFWISPNGHFFPVRFQRHDDVGMNIINKNKFLSKQYDLEENKQDIYSFLQKNKWLRVVKNSEHLKEYYADCFLYDVDSMRSTPFKPTDKSLKTLKDICDFYSFKFTLIKQ